MKHLKKFENFKINEFFDFEKEFEKKDCCYHDVYVVRHDYYF